MGTSVGTSVGISVGASVGTSVGESVNEIAKRRREVAREEPLGRQESFRMLMV